jgi:hypothetical protein
VCRRQARVVKVELLSGHKRTPRWGQLNKDNNRPDEGRRSSAGSRAAFGHWMALLPLSLGKTCAGRNDRFKQASAPAMAGRQEHE